MATTHIKLAKHLNGSPVKESDLKAGLVIYYPSGLGGMFRYRCKSVDEHSALFVCINDGWDYELEMKFSQPDFDLEDFRALSAAIEAFNKLGTYPTDEQREKVRKAHVLGYASQLSYTQVHWTQLGVNTYNQLVKESA